MPKGDGRGGHRPGARRPPKRISQRSRDGAGRVSVKLSREALRQIEALAEVWDCEEDKALERAIERVAQAVRNENEVRHLVAVARQMSHADVVCEEQRATLEVAIEQVLLTLPNMEDGPIIL